MAFNPQDAEQPISVLVLGEIRMCLGLEIPVPARLVYRALTWSIETVSAQSEIIDTIRLALAGVKPEKMP